MPKELKARLKKSGHTAVGLLRTLEEEIRRFITGGTFDIPEEKEEKVEEEDDFVMVENPDAEVSVEPTLPKKTPVTPQPKKILEKQILESLENDPGASFG